MKCPKVYFDENAFQKHIKKCNGGKNWNPK